jgi:hypothetical protein
MPILIFLSVLVTLIFVFRFTVIIKTNRIFSKIRDIRKQSGNDSSARLDWSDLTSEELIRSEPEIKSMLRYKKFHTYLSLIAIILVVLGLLLGS